MFCNLGSLLRYRGLIPSLVARELPWTWFSVSLTEATSSLIHSGNLIKRVHHWTFSSDVRFR